MFSCNLPPALLAEWPGSFTCYCSDMELKTHAPYICGFEWHCNLPPALLAEWPGSFKCYCGDYLFKKDIARFLNIHQSGVLKRWHGWCHMKLQPSRRKFCVHHTTMHHVTSCKATYVTVCVCLAVTCHLHFWQNDRDLLLATAVTRGWNGYRN